jgi:four helix bundle protein
MELSPTKGPRDGSKIWDIRERAFAFAVRIVKLCQALEERSVVSKTLIWQLLKAGTSVGANLEEAQAGQSRADFISKNSISLKEARESNYWLRVILASYDLQEKLALEARELRDEAREISLVVGSIIVTARRQL